MISVEYTITDLNQLIYNFAFDYLKKKYVKVSSKNITTGVVTNYTYGVHYVVVDKTIELLQPVGAVDDVLRIVRETSTSEQIVSWNDASILKASDMSLSQLQQLHILEEYSEYMSTSSLALDVDGQYDAKNSRIVNLATPQDSTDAVNRGYIDSFIGTLADAQTSVTLAQSWAVGDILSRPEGSSKEWATGDILSRPEGSSKEWAIGDTPEGSSKDWSIGDIVSRPEGSSKEWAIGDIPDGSSKDWSIGDTPEGSSKEWAIGDILSRPEGSSKYWSEQSKNYAEMANGGFNFRKSGRAYVVGDVVYSSSLPTWVRLDCIHGGTTASIEPTWGNVTAGQVFTDGEVKWRIVDVKSNGADSPSYFSRDIPFYASDKLTIATPNRLWLNIAKNGYKLETQKTFDISTDASWDSTATLWQANHDYAVNDVIYPSATKTGYYYRCTTAGNSSTLAPAFPTTLGATYNDGNVVWICELDFTVAANRKGKDFYIYSCIPANGTEPIIVLSANSTVPLCYTADTSRKIGGFHTLCANVGTITGHTLSGYVAGDILPASVWDLKHRPVCSPEGMVYVDGLDIWIDIYLASYTGSYSNSPENLKLVSKYGANTADGASAEKFHWYKFSQIFSRQKKRMLHHSEFIAASIGSNQSTNIYGSADVNTTGGHIDTASRRMISNFGLEDCCGFIWQWGQDDGGTNTGGSYANAYDANDKYVGGQSYADSSRVLLGGYWSDAAGCGSRCVFWANGPLSLYSSSGSRGASEPLRGAY